MKNAKCRSSNHFSLCCLLQSLLLCVLCALCGEFALSAGPRPQNCKDQTGDQAECDAIHDVANHFAVEPNAIENIGCAVGEDAGGGDEAEDEPTVGAGADHHPCEIGNHGVRNREEQYRAEHVNAHVRPGLPDGKKSARPGFLAAFEIIGVHLAVIAYMRKIVLSRRDVEFSKGGHDAFFVRQTLPIAFVMWQQHPGGPACEE